MHTLMLAQYKFVQDNNNYYSSMDQFLIQFDTIIQVA